VSLDDWVLALHVLSAFALVAAMIVFWVLVVAARRIDPNDERLGAVGKIGTVAIAAGSLGTLVFGTWLALSYGGYDLWDGWILAAFVLWVIGVGAGERAGAAFTQGDLQRGVLLHSISTVAILLILADMIWKPGA
jgi:heme A synthase